MCADPRDPLPKPGEILVDWIDRVIVGEDPSRAALERRRRAMPSPDVRAFHSLLDAVRQGRRDAYAVAADLLNDLPIESPEHVAVEEALREALLSATA